MGGVCALRGDHRATIPGQPPDSSCNEGQVGLWSVNVCFFDFRVKSDLKALLKRFSVMHLFRSFASFFLCRSFKFLYI